MRQFLREITERNGQSSSKKVWFNIACLAATVCLGWVCYKDTMEDWAFILFYLTYLLTVGGFEIILLMMDKIINFKQGGKNADSNNVDNK